ncbi:hypothetical protein ZOD2009_14616 [Haladaptatus paucihalophilus DX253]|uniref:Uncharacterized protein n=1 Tax=Haladaptatus paucihalophilus DX253 TaxID=797209 RepID=E7QVT7_HALPU|nr:hypothetical protein ZOD2009_14616 [Haladaptatus paucihalophilus DX253]
MLTVELPIYQGIIDENMLLDEIQKITDDLQLGIAIPNWLCI